MRPSIPLSIAAAAAHAVSACHSCYGPSSTVLHDRVVRRMQPGARNATVDPRAPLEWGQLNFLHTVSELPLVVMVGFR